MSLPEYLYKYRPVNAMTLMSLLNTYNWFSKPSSFNDPFDCHIKISNKKISFKEYMDRYIHSTYNKIPVDGEVYKIAFPKGSVSKDEFTDDFHNLIDNFREHLEFDVKNRFILSLSENFDNTTMWSHYSDNHTGICLEFSPKELIKNDKPEDFYIKVEYKKPNKIDFNAYNLFAYCENNQNIDKYKQIIDEIVSTKSDDWAYEAEWRVVHNREGAMGYYQHALTGVYFGLRCGVEEKRAIRNILANVRMSFFQMVRSENQFGLDALPMTKESEFWHTMP
ncbi:hypothetical protein A6033_03875 [Aeromonas veronii]|nr:hypothetical protein A6033_03875 [Aeromonas veronii]